MNYELNLEQFSGPIDKLLRLIEERKLEITELNLAEVTADFLNYLRTLTNADYTRTHTEGWHKSVSSQDKSTLVSPRLLADFVVIASQLLLIKSKALLPGLSLTNEEEKSIKDLESRLRFYQQFKPAISYLKKLSEQNNVLVSRALFAGRPAIFYPAENIKIEELYKAIHKIFETFKELSESQIIKSSLISLEEKIQEIINRVKKLQVSFKFQELTKGKPRSEIVVLFLALLHLLTDQLIKVEQKKRFEGIIIVNSKFKNQK
jgi:segregation and condensation protein A